MKPLYGHDAIVSNNIAIIPLTIIVHFWAYSWTQWRYFFNLLIIYSKWKVSEENSSSLMLTFEVSIKILINISGICDLRL